MRQLTLPALDPGPAPRPRTRHTWRPSAEPYGTTTCRSCTVWHRRGPFGARQGLKDQWSLDGKEWSDAEIPCSLKK